MLEKSTKVYVNVKIVASGKVTFFDSDENLPEEGFRKNFRIRKCFH
jgi:hypothetical protein